MSILNHSFSQIDHVNSFIETNQNSSLELFGTDDIFIHQSGKYIYAFSDTSILKYTIDSIAGEAISVELFKDKLYGINSYASGASEMAHTTDDKFLYILSYNQSAFSIFQVDQITGDCSFVDTVINNSDGIKGINNPQGLSISLDNKYLYVASEKKLITIFEIDPNTGNVNFIESNNHPLLNGVNQIRITPDNQYIYAASNSSSLNIFKRDKGTGLLTFYKQIERDIDNELFFSSISDIAFDSSGYVYITAKNDSSLIVFTIDGDYGNLVKYKRFEEGIDGIFGLDKPIAVEISPDQKYLYVLSNNFFKKTAITVFKWDKNKNLRFVSANVYTSPSDPGMIYNPSNLKISPDSRFLYVSELRNTICEFYKVGLFLNLGGDKQVCEGDTLLLSANDKYQSYEWSTQSNDSAITVTKSSEISLLVTDDYGKIGKDTVQVTFHNLPNIDLGKDTTANFNDTIKLSVTEGYNNYNWSTEDTTNSIKYIANNLFTNDTTFFVEVENQYGCTSLDSIKININKEFINLIDTTITVCDPFEYGDSLYIKSTIIWDTLTSSLNTDSVVVINLSVENPFATLDTNIISVYDTNHIKIYDTTTVTIIDTNHVVVYDTVIVYDTVHTSLEKSHLLPTGNDVLTINPNPTNGYVTLNSKEGLIQYCYLNDNNGVLLKKFDNIENNYCTLNIEQPPGVYLLTSIIRINGDRLKTVSKIIIE